jgi:hypothetical protein
MARMHMLIAKILLVGICGLVPVWLAWNKTVRWRIVSLVPLYVALLVIYASIYIFRFNVEPRCFGFSDTIVEGTVFNRFAPELTQVLQANREIFFLLVIASHSHELFDGKPGIVQCDDGALLEFTSSERWVTNYAVVEYELTVSFGELEQTFSSADSSIDLSGLYKTDNLAIFQGILERAVTNKRKSRDDLILRLAHLVREEPDWDFADFFYFSTVTMTTLGYGDITPNDTKTRMLVASQSLFGVFFVGFALAYLWP